MKKLQKNLKYEIKKQKEKSDRLLFLKKKHDKVKPKKKTNDKD